MKLSLVALPALALASPAALDKRTNECTKYGIDPATAAKVVSAFRSSKAIPDVGVPDITPKTELRGAYGSKQIQLGNTFQVPETLQTPTFDFDPIEGYDVETTRYTFVIVDPDAPGPNAPLLRNFLHMIVKDASPSCLKNPSPAASTVTSYMPLTPLSLAAHRYTLLLFRQPPGPFNPVVDGGVVTQAARAPFNLTNFVRENKLELVGGNFFREGLATLIPGLPGATQNGEGYQGPLDGTAEPANGIGNLL